MAFFSFLTLLSSRCVSFSEKKNFRGRFPRISALWSWKHCTDVKMWGLNTFTMSERKWRWEKQVNILFCEAVYRGSLSDATCYPPFLVQKKKLVFYVCSKKLAVLCALAKNGPCFIDNLGLCWYGPCPQSQHLQAKQNCKFSFLFIKPKLIRSALSGWY